MSDILTAISKGKKKARLTAPEIEFLATLEDNCKLVEQQGPHAVSLPKVEIPLPEEPKPEPEANPEPEPAVSGRGKAKGKGKGKAKDNNNADPAAEASGSAFLAPPKPEKRLKQWRTEPPQGVVERIHRCHTQRMFVIGRDPVEGANPPEEIFQMAGTTGNVYKVHIKKIPRCNCPDGIRKGTCKHILYIMVKVLKARAELVYQLALTSEELIEIFQNAPPPPNPNSSTGTTSSTSTKSNQKPLDADDCPICYYEFDISAPQDIVFCRAQCGSNLHAQCFKEWAASRASSNEPVTCVMCRTPWQTDVADLGDLKAVVAGAERGREGYVNVGAQLGLARNRR
ncbi:hypothetical protein DFH27DRAFT_476176 [Peziza echinospora]|nr:hypothetical protein DFH27DRAFT_476176 [Peziza echinospora]